MRPWGNALTAVLIGLAGAAAADGVVSSRGLPASPGAAGSERPVLRGTDGQAQGFGDQGVARGTGGQAGGLVRPDASGGAVVRRSDGRVQGSVPPPPRLPSYTPERRAP